ncbi:hypothetical protein P152DRAFT_43247 [Eremomyces bilateralis CBS 781.70]|uniref:Kinesin light chain n=1 Tax=Eremomyces bilateralis CBS 781.70 TaxID=1392243 RepID=A0A6G1G2L8_9PEZI|nr:uncharacterized protein P152DRAFT_43247 [Eremomyces bilateralis CBS 781.70]KAF1812049.1 hypothetical protein P152DRAFT_43247 [Eremomyces bilateralis CBS 781.70]
MAELAVACQHRHRWDQSAELLIPLTEMSKTVFGPKHPDIVLTMEKIAIAWEYHGRLEDAIYLMEECVELKKHIYGVCHNTHVALASR